MKLNIHQYGVLQGLGWVVVLTDGWILHWHWPSMIGLLLFIWSLWGLYKGTKDGF